MITGYSPTNHVDEAAVEKINQVVRDYSDSPALLGYFIVDESSTENFENMALIEQARSYFIDLFTWYNKNHRHSGIAILTPENVLIIYVKTSLILKL